MSIIKIIAICKLKNCRMLILLIALEFLISCIPISMVDSSSDPIYSSLVGRKLRLKNDVFANWYWTSFNPPEKEVILLIRDGVGIGGHGIIKNQLISKGAMYQIINVHTAKYFGPFRIRYYVKELGVKLINHDQIVIRVEGDINDASLGLDPNLWEVVPEER